MKFRYEVYSAKVLPEGNTDNIVQTLSSIQHFTGTDVPPPAFHPTQILMSPPFAPPNMTSTMTGIEVTIQQEYAPLPEVDPPVTATTDWTLSSPTTAMSASSSTDTDSSSNTVVGGLSSCSTSIRSSRASSSILSEETVAAVEIAWPAEFENLVGC